MSNHHYRKVVRGLFYSLLLAALLAGCAVNEVHEAQNPVRSQDPGLKPLVTDLLNWIEENSDYEVGPYFSIPPEVSFCERGESILYEGQEIVMHDPVKGVYDTECAKITLVRPWSKQNPENVSTLLHELIHFVQYSSKQWRCWHETEWEAYKLQELWLNQQGIDPGFNWLEIFLLSRCTPRDIHM